MKILKYFLLVAFLASCTSPKVVYDYDEAYDFSQLDSYLIYPDLVSNLNQLDEQRVISILAERMAEKGFTNEGVAQIYVNFYAQQMESPSRSSLGVGIGGGGGNMGVGVSGGIPIGTPQTRLQLVFDFIDIERDTLIWQAVVEGKFDMDTTPANKERRLRAFVDKALEGFPPNG